jgi:plastocyanin
MLHSPDLGREGAFAMWKLVLGAVLALPLAAAPVAGAATVPVSITKTGYTPSPASATTADTVKFTNTDTVAHQVAFKSATGVTCSPSPFALQAGQSGTCTFASAGSFSYSDPNATTLQGSLTVTEPAAPETLSLFAQAADVTYASKVVLTGELSSKKVGEDVTVLTTPCGRSDANKAATVQTTAGGEYTADLRSARNTLYTVQVKNTKSDQVSVNVRPRLRLGRIGAHRYSLRLFAAQKFAGRYATFQRYNGNRWVFVARVRLHSNSTNILPTVISSVAFRSSVRPRSRVRAFLPQSQAGACYLPGTSNVIRS